MARRLVLVPGVGLVAYESDSPEDAQVSVSSDAGQHASIETKINSISPVYWQNGKAYCDIKDETTSKWKQIQLTENQVSAFVAGNQGQSSGNTTAGLTSVSLSNFTGNTSKGLASGKPQFTLPYNTFTIYGPYADGGHAFIAVWVGSTWKYIDLDAQTGDVVGSTSIDYWEPEKSYSTQVVIQANTLWKCKIQHTSGQAFDSTLWQVLSAPSSIDHDSLAGKNDDQLFLHVTQADVDKWNGLQAQIDALASGTSIATSISIDNDLVLNEASNLDPHTIAQAKFLIKGAKSSDTVTINDASKISSVPASLVGSPTVQQEAGAWYLVVPLATVAYGTSYTLNVGTACVVMNGSMINANTVRCVFNTATAPSQPVVGISSMDGQFGLDPASLTSVSFPVTSASGTLDLRLQDASAFSCTPQNVISGAPQVDAQGGFLTFELLGTLSDTEYTITAKQGIVSNAGYALNSNVRSAKFGTVLSIPEVGQSPDSGNSAVDVTSTNKFMRFPLSTPSGRGTFGIADLSKITVSSPGVITNVTIISNVLNVYFTGGIDGDNITVTVEAGAIKNFNSLGDLKTNTSSRQCTIQYAIRAPVLSVPAINGNVDVSASVSTIDVPYNATASVTLDASKITSVPEGLVTGASLAVAGSQSVVRLTLASPVNDLSASISLAAGTIKNLGVVSSNAISFNFQYAASVPVVAQSSLNGSSVNASATSIVQFPVSGSALALVNTSLIVMNPPAITGQITLVNNVLSVPVTLSANVAYTITVNPGAVKNRNTLSQASTVCNFATATTFSVNQSSISGARIPVSSNQVTFTLSNVNGSASLTDVTKITSSGCTIRSVNVSGNVLTVGISGLSHSSPASVSVAAGALRDSVMLNTNTVTCSFTTQGNVPVVQQSATDGLTKVGTSVGFIEFPITASGTVSVANSSLVTSSQPGTIASVVMTGSVGSYKLRVNLNALANGTSFVISVAAGALANDMTLSANAIACSFKTIDAVPTVSQTVVNGSFIDSASFTTLAFPLTSQSACSIASASMIVATNATATASVVGSSLVVMLASLTVNKTVTIQVKAGAFQNADGVANTNSVTCTLYTKGDVPQITQSPASSQQSLAIAPAYIEYALAASGTIAIANANLISVVPNHFQSASIVSGKLRINLSLANDTAYTVTLQTGLLVNAQTLSTQQVTTSFKTAFASPVVNQSAFNGTIKPVGSFTLTFPVATAGTLALVNASLVSAVNASIVDVSVAGSSLVVTASSSSYSTAVSINVAAGAVTNGDAVNANAVSCTFTTQGSVPVVQQSPINTTTVAKSLSTVTFAVTGVSGALTLLSALKVSCPSGYDNILSSVSVSGTNIIVTLNTSATVYNKSYALLIEPGAVANDGVANANSITCVFTTQAGVPIVGQASLNGTVQPTTTSTAVFPIAVPSMSGTIAIANPAKVTATGATVNSVTIVGTDLVVSFSGLSNSSSASIAVASGAVSNSGVLNASSVVCAFTTLGSVPVVGQSWVNGTSVLKTTSTVVFPVTGISGSLTLASALKVTCPSGYDNIVASVSVSGSNLVVTLNSSAVAYNKAYAIQVDAGTVSNAGVLNANSVTCLFSTMASVPVVAQSSLHGTYQPVAASTASFAISTLSVSGALTIADVSKITATNATLTSKTIIGSNLVVAFSTLSNSANVSINIAAGAIANEGVLNTAPVTCSFTAIGVVVGIANSPDNGSTSITAGAKNIDFVLSATPLGTASVDNLKVTTTPSAKSSSATIVNVSGINYLRVPMTLASSTTYTIVIEAGAVINDTTPSASVLVCSFTTAAGSIARTVLWEMQFTLPNAASSINLFNLAGWGSKVLTTIDIYGPNYDGAGNMAEIRWYGYTGNITQPAGYVVPRSGIDSYSSTINPDKGYSFDDTNGVLQFDTGSPSPKIYKVIKYAS